MRLPCPAPTEKLTLALTRGRSWDCHSMQATEAQGIVIVKYKEVSRPSGRKVPAATRKLLSGAKRECTRKMHWPWFAVSIELILFTAKGLNGM